MKILELRLKNLNSLYGEWRIDFTHPEYDGIFALTGPTGAGKSTLLDAICLALYGATPRLGRISRSSAEVLSRQTGESYAEVLFESQAGRFRCHWEQRRSRKKAGGSLQPPEHQIIDEETQKPIETKKSLVLSIIEEKTGMDFERFTRSVLLAQGRFDHFLKADEEQKSKMLEQITGTELYSEISRRVHEREREEAGRLQLLQTEFSGIRLLSPEEEEAIRRELQTKQTQAEKWSLEMNSASQAVSWLTGLGSLERELHSLTEAETALKIETEKFGPRKIRLSRADQAARLEQNYSVLELLRRQQLQIRTALQTEQRESGELQAEVQKQIQAAEAAEQQVQSAKRELETAAPDLQKIRLLEHRSEELERAVREAEALSGESAQKLRSVRDQKTETEEKLQNKCRELEQIQNYLAAHAADETLPRILAGIQEQIRNLETKREELRRAEEEQRQAETSLRGARRALGNRENLSAELLQQVRKAAEQIDGAKNRFSRLLNGHTLVQYRSRKEELLRELAFSQTAARLEDLRTQLADGAPCPLCGSEQHPFTEGQIPSPDQNNRKIEELTELIQSAEQLEKQRETLETAGRDLQKQQSQTEVEQREIQSQVRYAENLLSERSGRLERIRADLGRAEQRLSAELEPFGAEGDGFDSVRAELEGRAQQWELQSEQQTRIRQQIAELEHESKRLEEKQQDRLEEAERWEMQLEQLRTESSETRRERRQYFSGRSADAEEQRLKKLLEQAEQQQRQTRDRSEALHRSWTETQTKLKERGRQLQEGEAELTEREPDFLSDLERAGFRDEKDFLEARLLPEERELLRTEAAELEERRNTLHGRREELERRLETEREKKLTEKTAAELEAEIGALAESIGAIGEETAGCRHKLTENETAKNRLDEKRSAVEAQQREQLRWQKLYELIGSADGKKYRNFAQGLTFELMISYANRQLAKMTDRYLLMRDSGDPLQLNVIDNDQGGEIRSVKNLSGGESFIVSLALALGLSQMASRKVRIDSLFLDEGFGTLDEDALDNALETLARLKQEGKMIGIISHLPALKDRIQAQLAVRPGSCGRSVLSGPGCQKLSGP